jgi:hypothetical protein
LAKEENEMTKLAYRIRELVVQGPLLRASATALVSDGMFYLKSAIRPAMLSWRQAESALVRLSGVSIFPPCPMGI